MIGARILAGKTAFAAVLRSGVTSKWSLPVGSSQVGVYINLRSIAKSADEDRSLVWIGCTKRTHLWY